MIRARQGKRVGKREERREGEREERKEGEREDKREEGREVGTIRILERERGGEVRDKVRVSDKMTEFGRQRMRDKE